MEPQTRKLLDQLRDAIRVRHYSIRTEESYLHWSRRYILFHYKWHPGEMGKPDIGTFLTHLAIEGLVAASTQNQPVLSRVNLPLNSIKPVLN